jgi:hypothetical protein
MGRHEKHCPARRALLAQGSRAAALALALPPALAQPAGVGVGVGVGGSSAGAGGVSVPVPAPFSTRRPGEDPPAPWIGQALRGIAPNVHALVEDAGVTVLEIRSSASASSLLHPLAGEAAKARSLRWRWKTDGEASRDRFGDKAGDDYAARVYLMFDYPLGRVPLGQRLLLGAARALHGEDLPAATLCYLLDPRAPAGTLIDSPYTSRVRMIVARSTGRTGVWWDEERDLAADFQRAFGEEHGPGVPRLRAIAVAADTDQGGASLRTRFGDLLLG